MTVALLFAALTLLLVSNTTFAQGPNLVPNPSFEENFTPPVHSNENQYPSDPFGSDIRKKRNPQALHGIMRGNTTFDTTFRGLSPDYLGDMSYLWHPFVKYWYRGNQATPDYYHAAATVDTSQFGLKEGVRVPYNWGVDSLFTEVLSDSAYAGIQIERATRNDGENDYHEYLATKLIDTLVVGQDYKVKFRYAMGKYKTTTAKKNDRSNQFEYYLKRLGVLVF